MLRRYFVLCILVACIAGCKYNPASEPAGTVKKGPGVGTGSFGYLIGSDSIVMQSDPMLSSAAATMRPEQNPLPPGSKKDMTVGLLAHPVINGKVHIVYLSFIFPLVDPAPQIYHLVKFGSCACPTVSLVIDTMSFVNNAGGTVEITKFDTVNNLLSGKFSLTLFRSSPTVDSTVIDTISGGYFTDVQIVAGGWNVGNFSAEINGAPYDTKLSPLYIITSSLSNRMLELDVDGPYTEKERRFQITIPSPHEGKYILGSTAAGPDTARILYLTYSKNGHSELYSGPGSTGSLTITKCDTVARRLWGTFDLAGHDYYYDTITIAKGTLENVSWAVF